MLLEKEIVSDCVERMFKEFNMYEDDEESFDFFDVVFFIEIIGMFKLGLFSLIYV